MVRVDDDAEAQILAILWRVRISRVSYFLRAMAGNFWVWKWISGTSLDR